MAIVALLGISMQMPGDGYHILVPGVGFDSVQVRKTTREDIIRLYGSNFKADTFYTKEPVEHRIIDHDTGAYIKVDTIKTLYSIRMNYVGQGMQFYFFPNQSTIFNIAVVPPFKGKTKLGIRLNKSTFNDVLKAYGKVDWLEAGDNTFLDYNGIIFKTKIDTTIKMDAANLKRKVTEICIDTVNNTDMKE
jgi:hypothetical protein